MKYTKIHISSTKKPHKKTLANIFIYRHQLGFAELWARWITWWFLSFPPEARGEPSTHWHVLLIVFISICHFKIKMLSLPTPSLSSTSFGFFLKQQRLRLAEVSRSIGQTDQGHSESAVSCCPPAGQREGPEGNCTHWHPHKCLSNLMLGVVMLG